MANYTKKSLNDMTVPELRYICTAELNIPGMSKKRKDVIINAILANQRNMASAANTSTTPTPVKESVVAKADGNGIFGVEGAFFSKFTKPNAKEGNKTTTVIQVSCGANVGTFDVVGKTVGQVAEFLREVLNVDRMSNGIVNGKAVDDSYVLKEDDILEYLKPAGKKG